MKALIQAFKHYLEITLGLQPDIKLWKEKGILPFFLQNLYEFYFVSLLGKPYLLAAARESDAITPAHIRKHLELLRARTGVPCIYLTSSLASYNRKRLIAHQVQFVIPNRQIYLPALGIDWMENSQIAQKLHPKRKTLTWSTQAVVIYSLIHRCNEPLIPLRLARALHYTPMTMTRSLNELESHGIGKIHRKGKERQIYFIEDRSQLWKQTEPFMQSPVNKRFWLKGNDDSLQVFKCLGVLAGLSALGEQSSLSQPMLPVYAISNQIWKRIERAGNIERVPSAEDADLEVEVWGYDPVLFAKDGLVDLFSLYLSLKEIKDERVDIALHKLMKSVKW